MDPTVILRAIFLGIVQGTTEFIPVSSSGHLEIVPRLFNWPEASTSFIIFLHLGTLLALVLFYRVKIWQYLKVMFNLVKNKGKLGHKDAEQGRVIVNIIIATVPAAVFGFLLKEFITDLYDAEGNANIAALLTLTAMAVIGVLFLFAGRLFTGKKIKLEKLSLLRAVAIGFSQVFAFIRGVSRSGITLISGQLVGLSRVDSAEFSFLMSIPIIASTSLYGIYEAVQSPTESLTSTLAVDSFGMIAAFISGFITIHILLKFLKNNGLAIFGWYRIVFAIVALLLIFA